MRWLSLFLVVITIHQLLFSGIVFAQQPLPEDQEELKKLLVEIEAELDQLKATESKYAKQGQTFENEIKGLNVQINALNLKIKAINIQLARLDHDIVKNKEEIKITEERLDNSRLALEKLLRQLYENDRKGLAEVVLVNPRLSAFFGNINNLLSLQDSLSVTVAKVAKLRDQLIENKENLALKRSDVVALKARQAEQKAAVASTKQTKDQLLAQIKGQRAKYQVLIKEAKKTAAEIRNRIFRLLGGGELPFGEAVTLAQVAERATGVRAAFILAILTQESSIRGVIGANLGSCYYNTPRNNVSGTVMKNDQKANFLALMVELGLDPNTMPVSCPIATDGAYGGAMGPAQFMPNTWVGYKDRISAITGGNPPSPFNNLDAFTATALYLFDSLNSSSCKNYANDNNDVLPYQYLLERCAAAKYYAGGNWYEHRREYGDDVASRSVKFQADIDVLNG